MTKSDIMCIKTFGSRSEAQIAQSALTSAGITSLIYADDAGGAYPFPLSVSGKGVKLMINSQYKQKAKKILSL